MSSILRELDVFNIVKLRVELSNKGPFLLGQVIDYDKIPLIFSFLDESHGLAIL